MISMTTCGPCGVHIRATETSCPFCGAPVVAMREHRTKRILNATASALVLIAGIGCAYGCPDGECGGGTDAGSDATQTIDSSTDSQTDAHPDGSTDGSGDASGG